MRSSSAVPVGFVMLLALVATAALVMAQRQDAPTLECSVDDTLTFVAYDVTQWDMRDGILVAVSREDGELFAMSRILLLGETCRETRAAE